MHRKSTNVNRNDSQKRPQRSSERDFRNSTTRRSCSENQPWRAQQSRKRSSINSWTSTPASQTKQSRAPLDQTRQTSSARATITASASNSQNGSTKHKSRTKNQSTNAKKSSSRSSTAGKFHRPSASAGLSSTTKADAYGPLTHSNFAKNSTTASGTWTSAGKPSMVTTNEQASTSIETISPVTRRLRST